MTFEIAVARAAYAANTTRDPKAVYPLWGRVKTATEDVCIWTFGPTTSPLITEDTEYYLVLPERRRRNDEDKNENEGNTRRCAEGRRSETVIKQGPRSGSVDLPAKS